MSFQASLGYGSVFSVYFILDWRVIVAVSPLLLNPKSKALTNTYGRKVQCRKKPPAGAFFG